MCCQRQWKLIMCAHKYLRTDLPLSEVPRAARNAYWHITRLMALADLKLQFVFDCRARMPVRTGCFQKSQEWSFILPLNQFYRLSYFLLNVLEWSCHHILSTAQQHQRLMINIIRVNNNHQVKIFRWRSLLIMYIINQLLINDALWFVLWIIDKRNCKNLKLSSQKPLHILNNRYNLYSYIAWLHDSKKIYWIKIKK